MPKPYSQDLRERVIRAVERLLDWIEIGRIFWQIKQPRPRSFDGLLHNNTLVSREVVDDDDVAALERWPQTLFEIGEEDGSGHGPIHHERRNHLVMAKPSYEGDGFPMPLRHVADQPLAAPAAAPKPYHILRTALCCMGLICSM